MIINANAEDFVAVFAIPFLGGEKIDMLRDGKVPKPVRPDINLSARTIG